MDLNLNIDHNRLDVELGSLPNEILVWARESADRQLAQHKADAALRQIEAETSLKIRQAPLDYGHAKLTEDLVKNLVAVQPEVIAAQEALMAAKHEANVSRSIVEALDAKRSSLKYLAELVVAGFLSSTTIQPRGVKNVEAVV